MTLTDARTALERLDRDECLELLAREQVGRLAVVHGGAPEIFPVNYVLDGSSILFRTAPGTKLVAGSGRTVCFEVDGFNTVTCSGWSVVVSGRLEEVTRYAPTTWERVEQLSVEPWAPGKKPHCMLLVASRISGRRVGASR